MDVGHDAEVGSQKCSMYIYRRDFAGEMVAKHNVARRALGMMVKQIQHGMEQELKCCMVCQLKHGSQQVVSLVAACASASQVQRTRTPNST